MKRSTAILSALGFIAMIVTGCCYGLSEETMMDNDHPPFRALVGKKYKTIKPLLLRQDGNSDGFELCTITEEQSRDLNALVKDSHSRLINPGATLLIARGMVKYIFAGGDYRWLEIEILGGNVDKRIALSPDCTKWNPYPSIMELNEGFFEAIP